MILNVNLWDRYLNSLTIRESIYNRSNLNIAVLGALFATHGYILQRLDYSKLNNEYFFISSELLAIIFLSLSAYNLYRCMGKMENAYLPSYQEFHEHYDNLIQFKKDIFDYYVSTYQAYLKTPDPDKEFSIYYQKTLGEAVEINEKSNFKRMSLYQHSLFHMSGCILTTSFACAFFVTSGINFDAPNTPKKIEIVRGSQ